MIVTTLTHSTSGSSFIEYRTTYFAPVLAKLEKLVAAIHKKREAKVMDRSKIAFHLGQVEDFIRTLKAYPKGNLVVYLDKSELKSLNRVWTTYR